MLQLAMHPVNLVDLNMLANTLADPQNDELPIQLAQLIKQSSNKT